MSSGPKSQKLPLLFGLAGWSGSGKTTLAVQLIQWFAASGFSVGSIKHAHHEFDADHEGKDSWRHRKAGAGTVIISSTKRTARFTEHEEDHPPQLDDLLKQMPQQDIILVEGFKASPVPKIEIFRPELDKPALYHTDPFIKAIASPTEPSNCSIRWLPLDSADDIARFILTSGLFSIKEAGRGGAQDAAS